MRKDREVFRLKAVHLLDRARLHLEYADGRAFTVDLTDLIRSTKALRPLRDRALFSTARLGAFGRSVEFANSDIDLAADNLRNLAIEQAGGIGHERIWNWMHENDLKIDQAAEVLGISRRMLIYYRNGEKAIPRHIWLACVGWETLRTHKEAA